jgi:hypothetical protein
MDEVRVVRRRTHIWPVVIAVIILAIVIAWAFFAMDRGVVEPDIGHLMPSPAIERLVAT